jgi:hypothetical protein
MRFRVCPHWSAGGPWHPSSLRPHRAALLVKGLLIAIAAALLIGCADPSPQAQLKAALDTTTTHQGKLEAAARFIESTVLSQYNTLDGLKWERRVPDAIRQVHADLARAGFKPARDGQAYRVPSMIYAHERHQVTMWIEAARNKLRIVVADCDESASRQLIASQLILSRRGSSGASEGPIQVVHRSRTHSTVPDDWVPCAPTENQ